jgi:hypothetical protein
MKDQPGCLNQALPSGNRFGLPGTSTQPQTKTKTQTRGAEYMRARKKQFPISIKTKQPIGNLEIKALTALTVRSSLPLSRSWLPMGEPSRVRQNHRQQFYLMRTKPKLLIVFLIVSSLFGSMLNGLGQPSIAVPPADQSVSLGADVIFSVITRGPTQHNY